MNNRMNILLLLAAMAFEPAVALTADDVFVKCSTPGRDTYADGTTVADGECYALVYTKPGFEFAGFNADGSVAKSDESDLVAVAPVAKDGRCPATLFVLSRSFCTPRQAEGGKWELFLLDTRRANGVPAGLSAGVLSRVRRWGRPGVAMTGAIATPRRPRPLAAGEEEGGASATEVALLPVGTGSPRITGIRVVNGKVQITAVGTYPFLTYGVHDVDAPATVKDVKDGQLDQAVEFEFDADAASGLFKVTSEN